RADNPDRVQQLRYARMGERASMGVVPTEQIILRVRHGLYEKTKKLHDYRDRGVICSSEASGRMQQRHRKPNTRSHSGDLAQVRPRLGVARSRTRRAALEGADAAHPILEPAPSAAALARTASASAKHGDVHAGHRTAGSERDR